MSCLTKAMLAQGASYPEVQAVLDADRTLNANRSGEQAAIAAEQVIDDAAAKYLGMGIEEDDS